MAIDIVSGQQPDSISFLVSENPVAVVLLFVDPAGLVERLADQRGEHRLNA
jgi:hypothetical protein